MAWNVQNPGKRCLVTPLHISELQGTGRGWITEKIKSLVGGWNCSEAEIDDIVNGQWGDHLYQKTFCFVHEARANGDRFHVVDRLRKTLTEKTQRLNLKHGESGTFEVFTSFFMMTNFTDAFAIPKTDRRIQVLTGPDYKIGDGSGEDQAYTDYYDKLYGLLQGDGAYGTSPAVNQFYWWLMRRDVSKFRFNHATMTIGKQNMAGFTKSDNDVYIDEFIRDMKAEIFGFSQIKRYIQYTSGDQLGKRDEAGIKAALRERCTESGGRIKINKNRYDRPWVLKGSQLNVEDKDAAKEHLTHIERLLADLFGGGEDFMN